MLLSTGRFFDGTVGTTDPYWSSTPFLCSMAGADEATTWIDEGSLAQTISSFGNVKVDDAVPNFSQNTTLFDGTGDYLTVPHNAAFDISNNNDVTMEGSIYTTTTGKTQIIFDNRGTASGANGFHFFVSTGNKLGFDCFSAATIRANILGATTLSTSTWYHVAAVRTNGQDWRIFVNGVSDGTSTESAPPNDSSDALAIGRAKFNTTRDFQGRMCEMRYTNAARYTGTFTPPSARFPRG